MCRTMLACAVLLLWAAVRCDADAYSVDRRDDDAGKGYLDVKIDKLGSAKVGQFLVPLCLHFGGQAQKKCQQTPRLYRRAPVYSFEIFLIDRTS